MLVRSASTPVLGALHHPSSGCHSPAAAVPSPAFHFSESPATAAYHPPHFSCHLPGSGSDHDQRSRRRRASSEGNLASLAVPGRGCADDHHLLGSGKGAPRARPVALETIQSFTVDGQASTDDEQEEEGGYEVERDREVSSFVGGGACSQQAAHPLFLARGLGIDRLGSGLLSAGGGFGGSDGGGSDKLVASGDGGRGDHRSGGIETHYKTMIVEDPCNGLFLRNYAQFLHQINY